ncbi:hypothetical protein [Neorhizobium sp. T25_27]|uniref:hypothetical protein n=1 Tax=Neorhizobium sp. T25_27 TaxID=2093831 RepID=UPI000CF94170|nr:hypothetical protein [Neorhizobium sp. T25_27]
MSQPQCFESHLDRIIHEMPRIPTFSGFEVIASLMRKIEDYETLDASAAEQVFMALMDAYSAGKVSGLRQRI